MPRASFSLSSECSARMETQPECRGVKKSHRVLYPNPFRQGNDLMGSYPLAYRYSIYKFLHIYLVMAGAATALWVTKRDLVWEREF